MLESRSAPPCDQPSNLVISADHALLPGLVLAGNVSRFDHDGTDPDHAGGDSGWQAVGRISRAS